MIPHTLVLKPGLVIYSIYDGYWFWGRPSITDLWHDLRRVSSEVRPDWDLSAPGLRERWDAGDFAPFHGWNKRAGRLPRHSEGPRTLGPLDALGCGDTHNGRNCGRRAPWQTTGIRGS